MKPLERINWNDERVSKFGCFGRESMEHLKRELVDAIYDEDACDIEARQREFKDKRDNGGEIEVVAYNRIILKPAMFAELDDVKCELEEQNLLSGDPGTNWEEFTPEGLAETKAAYDAFVATFIKNYQVWACEPAAIIVVPVKELYDEAGETEREEWFGEGGE